MAKQWERYTGARMATKPACSKSVGLNSYTSLSYTPSATLLLRTARLNKKESMKKASEDRKKKKMKHGGEMKYGHGGMVMKIVKKLKDK